MIISINQKIIDSKQATIPLGHHAFLNGFAVFETLRTYNRLVFRLEDHLERLFQSAGHVGLVSPWSEDQVKQTIKRLLAVSKKKTEMRFRIILADQDLIVMMMELEEKPKDYYEKGIDLVSYEGVRFMPEAKILGSAVCYLANQHAKAKNAYDSILINPYTKLVTECSYANLFWVKNKQLYTTDENILKGITRETVIELAGGCQFKTIDLDELKKMDEIFITQTTSGILPVKLVDGVGFEMGKVTRRLMGDIKNLTWN